MAITAAMVMGGIQAGSMMLNGYADKKHAKKMANIQREIANMQYNYNKKKIKEATEVNIRGLLKKYATAHEDLHEQKEKVRMNLNFKAQMKGVEKEDNSYIADSVSKLNAEFRENMQTLASNRENDLFNIAKQGSDQLFQASGDFNSALANINNQEIQAKRQAEKMMADGFMKAVSVGMDAYKGMKGGNAGNGVKTGGDSFDFKKFAGFTLNALNSYKFGGNFGYKGA